MTFCFFFSPLRLCVIFQCVSRGDENERHEKRDQRFSQSQQSGEWQRNTCSSDQQLPCLTHLNHNIFFKLPKLVWLYVICQSILTQNNYNKLKGTNFIYWNHLFEIGYGPIYYTTGSQPLWHIRRNSSTPNWVLLII